MPARSVVIQLQAGVGQAILPDHRKMLPGIQYVVEWDTFQKLSNSARQNIIQVVAVNSDSTATASSFVVNETATSLNGNLSLSTLLTTTTTSAINYNLAGIGAMGYDGVAGIGVGPSPVGAAINNTVNGPAGERYMYIYNSNVAISGGQVAVWADETNRWITATRPTFTVAQDGQGTAYQVTFNNTATSPTTVGTKQGRFAGIALTTIASGSYGWIQIEGLCPSVAVTGTVAAVAPGATLAVGGQAVAKIQGASTASVNGNVVTGTALANNVFGTILASGTTAGGYWTVDIRGVKAKKPYVRFLNKN